MITIDEAIKLLKLSDQAIWLKGLEKERKEAETMAIKALEQEPCEDTISRQAVLNLPRKTLKNYFGEIVGDVIYVRDVMELPTVTPKPKTGRCEECKHFRKLPYHSPTLGKCFQHAGFCPKGDWYCADFEPQESEGVRNDKQRAYRGLR